MGNTMTRRKRKTKSSAAADGGTSFYKGGIRKKGKPLIGFIGQGFVGKNYADDFERRGYTVIRYAKSPEYQKNKAKIQNCAIVFIAVPTPSTPSGFDYSVVESVLPLVGRGKTAVIKSTILPGTTEALQKQFPAIFVFHSPEFLRERSAAFDAAHPERNIIGTPKETDAYRKRAKGILAVLPKAPYESVLPAREAELVKYAGNCLLYLKVVFANMLYDVAQKFGGDWERIREAVAADPRIGSSHLNPVHRSGHANKAGRGAGGHCFIKDFAAFSRLYQNLVGDAQGVNMLRALRDKNNDLLLRSGKDIDLLEGVYGRTRRS